MTGGGELEREAYADYTAWEEGSNHQDPQSTPQNPRWFMVDVRMVQSFEPPLSRRLLREEPELAGMELMKKGSRLSIQPVTASAFAHIMNMVVL